jgi:hypothetical protein
MYRGIFISFVCIIVLRDQLEEIKFVFENPFLLRLNFGVENWHSLVAFYPVPVKRSSDLPADGRVPGYESALSKSAGRVTYDVGLGRTQVFPHASAMQNPGSSDTWNQAIKIQHNNQALASIVQAENRNKITGTMRLYNPTRERLYRSFKFPNLFTDLHIQKMLRTTISKNFFRSRVPAAFYSQGPGSMKSGSMTDTGSSTHSKTIKSHPNTASKASDVRVSYYTGLSP